jgi:hypothetical protein
MYIKASPCGGLKLSYNRSIARLSNSALLSSILNQYNTKQDVGYYLIGEGPNLGKLVSLVPFNPFELIIVAMAPHLSPFARASAMLNP